MTTVYKFKAYYTDAGVGTVQDPAPTCTVINMADDSKLADAQATTASTNMPGLYSYEYSGNDGLDCVAWFKTTDTGCDVKELASYVSEKITTNLNADVAGVETKLDTVDANVDSILADTSTDGVKIADDAITASKFDENTAFPLKKADALTTELARKDSASSYMADVSGLATATALTAVDDLVDDLETRLTAVRAGYLDKLNVSGTLAHSNDADTYKANVSAITGAALSAAGIDAILDEIVVGTYTMRQILTVAASALAGKLSGGGTTTLTFRGINDDSNVIVATVDANGNRSAVTVTV